MTKMIFVNLPVTDLAQAKAFYEALGFTNNAQFSDSDSACMVWSETVHVMLLTHSKWRGFTSRPIPPPTSSEVMLAISCESREAVDHMNAAAAANGGQADINPKQDLGFLYNRNLADPDGHVWEAVWMDPSAMAAPA
jgi:predicted lactoylglutathione lyase